VGLLLTENFPGHDIPRGELRQSMTLGHEPLPLGVEQHRALSTHRLGDEGQRVFRGIEGRGVELHELHVGQTGAGPVGNGKPVAGGHLRVRGISENLTASTGGEHRGVGHDLHRPTGDGSADPGALQPALVLHQQQVEHPGGLLHVDIRRLAHLGDEGPGHLGAGLVPVGVHDPVAGMRRLLPQLEITGRIEVETGPGGLEFADPGGPFFHQHLHRFGIAQRRAGRERILPVQIGRVAGTQCGGDPPLRVGGSGVKKGTLGEHRHGSVGRSSPGGV